MTEKTKLQQVAKPESKQKPDPIGYGAVGREVLFEGSFQYFRNRAPPIPDPVEGLAQHVSHYLTPLLGQGDDAPGSNGSLARAALARLEAVRHLVSTLPEEHQAIGAQILLLAWQGGLHEGVVTTRKTGMPNARRGRNLSVHMKEIRDKSQRERAHKGDADHFIDMERLITDGERAGQKKLGEMRAALAVLYPHMQAIPASAAGSHIRAECNALRKRFRRYIKKIGTLTLQRPKLVRQIKTTKHESRLMWILKWQNIPAPPALALRGKFPPLVTQRPILALVSAHCGTWKRTAKFRVLYALVAVPSG